MKKNLRTTWFHLFARTAILSILFLQTIFVVHGASQFMDYFTETPVVGSLSSNCWGAPEVGPRDQSNGLEDRTMSSYCYWDGGIIKGLDGVYHMFGSRWDQAAGHNGWFGSVAVHATSNNLYGPYTDRGLIWPWDQGGKGHNVLPLVLKDGRYAVYVSETRRPTVVYVSDNLNGPWSRLGTVSIASNAYSAGFTHSNTFIMLRPDGRYGIISRDALVGVADNVLGPYTIQGPNIYAQTAGTPTGNMEDPCMWYSGGMYHVIANKWDTRKAYHLTSSEGTTNWKLDAGYAYDPTANFIRYTDGTINHWNKLERFNVYIEDDHVAAITLSAIDVAKDADHGYDRHGSKVIVVPFDGVRFDEEHAPTPSPTLGPTPVPVQEPIFSSGPDLLDGIDDYVDLPDGLTGNLGDISIACRVKLNTLDTWSRIFDFGGDTNVFMMLTPASGNTGYPYFCLTTSGTSGEQGVDGTSALPTGSWQHIAVVLNGDTGILYVNAQEVGRNTGITLKPANLGNTLNNYIGRSQWEQDPYLNGEVDNFYIYNRALSAEEVANLANGGSTGTPGDANGDGSVNIVDALLIAQYYVGLDPPGFIETNSDVNCDGLISIVDALLIAQYYVGLITEFSC